ncbi:MAG: alpha-2-macroglobulin family protein [Rhodobacterales bacterium]|nr:alpha-2-macroglobulin family protein [Rhodobacterales bacterium]
MRVWAWVGLVLMWGSLAAAQDLIPERRLVLSTDTDLPGGDIAQLFDTTLEACERACLAQPACTAFTFNTRNGSCFPKAAPGLAAGYAGAISGLVRQADPAALAQAPQRRDELAFLSPRDLAAARDQAGRLADSHVTGPWTAADHRAAAAREELAGNWQAAADFTGAALNLTDAPADWADYARRLFLAAQAQGPRPGPLTERALSAGVNGYLRSPDPALRHTILAQLAPVLEVLGRGRDMVAALRLAQALQPRDDTAAALDAAIATYGFRIETTEVQFDSARPRLCAQFTEDLVDKGLDYTPYVQLPEPGLTVVPGGRRQLCVEGVRHGQRVSVTFREGLPAADGQVLAKSVPVTLYVRDRTPAARFPGRTYVLPRLPGAAVPIEAVNAPVLDLTLYRVDDRNLLRAIQNDYLRAPIAEWQEGSFAANVGAQVWQGTAEVGVELNRDVTTRLPMDDAIAGLPAGIYALRALPQGKQPWDVPPAWQWFVLSDLGLASWSGTDGLTVAVRGLTDAAARPGVTVELISRGNAVLGTAMTDDQGVARFAAGLTRGTGGQAPALVVARQGQDDLSFLSLTDPEFDLSDRGVAGREPAPPVDVFVTADRGAYRAGETVHLLALARDGQAAAVDGLPLTVVVKRPDGVEHSRAVMQPAGQGGHTHALPVAATAPRGLWRAEIRAEADGPALAAATFLVEDFLPERIGFALTLPEAPIRLGDLPDLTVEARYLFGAPGADLAIEGETLLSAATDLPGFAGFRFGRHDDPFAARMEPLPPGQRTDAAGRAVVALPLPDVADPLRPLQARVTLRLAEGSGRPVERTVTRLLAPSAPVIGIKTLFDGAVPEGTEAPFQIVAVGPAGDAVPMAVRWTLTRLETRYQWYQQYGNWNWEPVTTRSRVAEGAVDLTAAPAALNLPVGWGEYELLVEQADGRAAASVTFGAGWYAPADAAQTPDLLELSLDRPAYRAGEVARLRLVPQAAGVAVVSVLSNRVVAMQAVPVSAGENVIDLPVTDDWGAGVYVTAQVIRPLAEAAGHVPARALGLAHAAVDPGARRLGVAVQAPAAADPRGPLPVAVRVDGVAPGDTALVTLAAVDLGILNLTGFAAPDPSAHYFGQRKLGVALRDLYGRLIDGQTGAQGTVRSGGDAGAQARLQAPPPTEQLLAWFSGPLTVGADGYARTSLDLPAFNGTVRLMAVAWSGKAVGQASADVLVRDPVVVTASLPRFLAPGDESRLLLEVVHATGPAGRMGLDVTATGLLLGPVPSGLDLAPGGRAVVTIPVTAGGPGLGSVQVRLSTPDGRVLTRDLALPVQTGDPEIARTTRFDLAPGATFAFGADAFAGLVPGTALATLAIGPVAQLDAPGLLAALDRYPWGCAEQVTSAALPLLYFEQMARLLDRPFAPDIRTRIDQAVAAVLQNQSAEGGFGLWGPGSGDPWLDAYVTDFLSRARAQGVAVPDRALRAALDNLRNQVNYAPDFDRGGEALAYALMVLAREGAAAIGDLRYYADVKADALATPLAMAQLGAALAAYGDQPRADAMFARALRALDSLPPDGAQLFRADYGSARRDAAGVLALAAEAGSSVVPAQALIPRIAAPVGGLSTQEAVWSLLATRALVDAPGIGGVTLDGAPAQGPLVRVLEGDAITPIAVANAGPRPQQITVTAFGVPEADEPPGGNGYAITRSYLTLDGQPVALDQPVAQGTRLVAVIEVTPFAEGEARLMVTDPLPAGFEIDNPNLMRSGDVAALDFLSVETEVTHAEFRQDRFLAALDRMDGTPFRLAYVMRAVSPGTFRHPAASVEDMYRPAFRARSETGRVTVTE